MPRRWYTGGAAAFVLWALTICGLATIMPGPPRGVELAGTLLTLLPVMLDLFRKYYVHRHAPATEEGFTAWARERVQETLLGYEPLYAVAVFLGVSLVALGFAMDFFQSANC
jgi:hypothetical protein